MAKQPSVPILPTTGGPIKLIISFASPDRKWQEVHWYQPTTDLSNSSMATAALALCNARAVMLAASCSVTGWRLSQENVFGDSRYNPPDFIPRGALIYPVEEGNDCIPVFVQGTTQYRRTMYLGGIPSSVINSDTLDLAGNPAFFNNLQAYFQLLTLTNPYSVTTPTRNSAGGVWGFLPRQAPTNAFPVANVTGFTFANNSNLFTVTLNKSSGAVVGDVVALTGVQNVNANFPLNQLWVVSAVAAAPPPFTLTLQGFPAQTIPVVHPPASGTLRRVVRQFQPYTGYALDEPGTRRRGVSEGAPKGRKKKKWNIGFPG